MEKILCYRGFQVGENQHRCCTSVTVGWKHRYVGLRSFRGRKSSRHERRAIYFLLILKTNAEFLTMGLIHLRIINDRVYGVMRNWRISSKKLKKKRRQKKIRIRSNRKVLDRIRSYHQVFWHLIPLVLTKVFLRSLIKLQMIFQTKCEEYQLPYDILFLFSGEKMQKKNCRNSRLEKQR